MCMVPLHLLTVANMWIPKAMVWRGLCAAVSAGAKIGRPRFLVSAFFIHGKVRSRLGSLSRPQLLSLENGQVDQMIAEALCSSDCCLWLRGLSWPVGKSESSLASLDRRSWLRGEKSQWYYQKCFTCLGARKVLTFTSHSSWWNAVNR